MTLRRNIIIGLLIGIFFFQTNSFSQKSEKFFEINNDTITFFLNNSGDITTKVRSIYYRKAKISLTNFSYEGVVKDYFLDNRLAFYQSFENNEISGYCSQYFYNGELHHTGQYINSLKEGVWNYYYNNGKLEKVIHYTSGHPRLQEFYKKNGKTVFSNGNGKYKGNIIIGHKSTSSYRISGYIKNGQLDGWWDWPDGKENFKDGELIKGLTSWSEYTKNPAISLTGFNLHEEVSIFKFIAVPKSNQLSYGFSELLYFKNSNNLDEYFKTDFIKHLTKINSETNSQNYWCFIQFNINKNNITNNIEIYSNNEIISLKLKTFILNLRNFNVPAPNKEPTECTVYLSFIVEDGEIIIPKYSFASSNNVMDLIPKQ